MLLSRCVAFLFEGFDLLMWLMYEELKRWVLVVGRHAVSRGGYPGWAAGCVALQLFLGQYKYKTLGQRRALSKQTD